MAKIIWLASYPKSGNTWLRAFLTNYLGNNTTPADINELEGGPIATSRPHFDDIIGVEAADLTQAEVECLRPAVYEELAAESAETLFLKVHDAFVYNPAGQPLLSKRATAGAIYLIRNPLEVAVSYAHHTGLSLDVIIGHMAVPLSDLCGDYQQPPRCQLSYRLLAWSEHLRSWVDEPDLRLHLMRYEDMKADPRASFGAAVRFAGLPFAEERLQCAIDHASFAQLQAQERAQGFREKTPFAQAFFRKGESGSWRTALMPAQIARIVQDHGAMMRRFGYLSAAGEGTE